MDARQLEHFRRRLLEEREAVVARIAAAKNRAQAELSPDPLAASERPERSDLSDTFLRIGTRLTEQRHELDDALMRIELGEYGRCERCGEPIEMKRLEAEPAARWCRRHAALQDRTHPPSL